ncbi:hypothetical protein Tco_0712729 [Tanacetum coccineum]
MLIADIAETFDNLRRINMKLNPKKCSFRVEEGKFLRYMVTSEGIRANPKKTKAIADMQSPRTLKEMQSLSEITNRKERKGHNERKQERIPLDRKREKGIPRNEAMHNGVAVVNHSLELGAYNIAYEPRSSIKGQLLADFLSEAPVGTHPEEFFRLPADVPNQDEVEKWTLFTDGASNNKGSGQCFRAHRPSGR